jgi:spore maturation protein CgeB
MSRRLDNSLSKQEERTLRNIEKMYARMQVEESRRQQNIQGNINSYSVVNNVNINHSNDLNINYNDIRSLLMLLHNREFDINAIGSHTLDGDIIDDVHNRLIQHHSSPDSDNDSSDSD